MKLLVTSKKCENIYQLSSFLRSKGIAACIVKQNVRLTGAHAGLWIVLDSQYRDALLLYENPSHEVSCPLSEEEIVELDEKVKEYATEKLNGISGVLFAVAVALLVMFIGGVYGWFYLMGD